MLWNVVPSLMRGLLVLLFFVSTVSYGASGRAVPSFELGMIFHSGADNQSLGRGIGFFTVFRAEPKRGFFRPHIGVELDYNTGQASFAGTTSNFTTLGGGFLAGFNLHPFKEGRFLPFIGAEGVASWQYLVLSNPGSLLSRSSSLFFGFEAVAGADLRFWSIDGRAIRVKTGFLWTIGDINGMSGFQIQGVRFSLGILF